MQTHTRTQRRIYKVLCEVCGGDRATALEAWMRLYPRTNPVAVLGEDQELVDALPKPPERSITI